MTNPPYTRFDNSSRFADSQSITGAQVSRPSSNPRPAGLGRRNGSPGLWGHRRGWQAMVARMRTRRCAAVSTGWGLRRSIQSLSAISPPASAM